MEKEKENKLLKKYILNKNNLIRENQIKIEMLLTVF